MQTAKKWDAEVYCALCKQVLFVEDYIKLHKTEDYIKLPSYLHVLGSTTGSMK